MSFEPSSAFPVRRSSLTRLYVLLGAALSSSVVVVTTILMVAGPSGLA